MVIRQMLVGDLATVAAIEASAVSLWSLEQIASELKRKSGISLVAVASNGELQAWCCGFQTGVDAELLKITVNPLVQRLGIGEDLLQELCLLYAKRGARQMYLEVRSQNRPALNLYAKQNFQEVGRRKSYYKEPADDVVILAHRLNVNATD
jgi:ribosomal-protein-alanine acetyltransferase